MKTVKEYLNLPYRIEVIPSRDEGGFIVSYPELPGCLSCGETIEQAIANAKDAKIAWIEAALEDGVEISEPNSSTAYSTQIKLGIMQYKGYKAAITYDETEGIFIGKVIGISDSLNFHGISLEELESSFHACVDNYLDACTQIGKEPQKWLSGSLNVKPAPKFYEHAAAFGNENEYSLEQAVSITTESMPNNSGKVNSAMSILNASAEVSGSYEMTLDEINAEINQYRKERRETK